jgi:hypothetical protein
VSTRLSTLRIEAVEAILVLHGLLHKQDQQRLLRIIDTKLAQIIRHYENELDTIGDEVFKLRDARESDLMENQAFVDRLDATLLETNGVISLEDLRELRNRLGVE